MCLRAACRSTGHDRRAWLLFGLGCLDWFAAQVVWDAYNLLLGVPVPFPGLPDFGYLSACVLFIGGMFCYGSDRRAVGPLQVANLAIIFCSVAIIAGVLLTDPVALSAHGALYGILAFAYPVLWVTNAAFGAVCLGLYTRGRKRFVFVLLLLAMATHGAVDFLYGYQLLLGDYLVGSNLDPFWVLGFAFLFWAAFEHDGVAGRTAVPAESRLSLDRLRLVEGLVPAVAVGAIILAVGLFARSLSGYRLHLLIPAAAVLAVMLGVREYWAFRHHLRLRRAAEDAAKSLRQHQRELEAALAANRAIIDHSFDVICVLDETSAFTRVSPRAREMWGYDPASLVGRSALDLVIPEDRQVTAETLARIRIGIPTSNSTTRVLRADGRIIHVQWSAIWSEEQQAIFAVARDLTQHMEAEEKLRSAQRMEAVGQLTGGIAHDFNNLLTVLIGNSDLLMNALVAQPELCALAEMSHMAAERGADLTSRLLLFSRRQPLVPRALNPSARIEAMSDLLRRTLGDDIRIELRLPQPQWLVNTDPAQLESALLNLAINARDAMPGGGTLGIETGNVALDQAEAASLEVPAGEYVAIVVRDSGSGMSPEVLQRAFEPFFTTKDPGKGTGLGLSTVYGFIRQSGGQITIESAVGRGTAARILLPRAATAVAEDDVSSRVAPARGRGETILVVEDNELMRSHIGQHLRAWGYRVVDAANGPAALSILAARPDVDLLFTDLIMPGGLNGVELARRARARFPKLGILLSTGYADRVDIPADPAYRLLRKPYGRNELASTVRAALDEAA